MEERDIGESVRSIFDIIYFTLKEIIPALVIFLDLHKAFNNLERKFLLGCLDAFGFGSDFIRWVKTIYYRNLKSCVINNGIITDYFSLQRGVK